MSERKVVISMTDWLNIYFLDVIVAEYLKRDISKVNGKGIFYACMIQAGIEEFITLPDFCSFFSKSEFLSSRFSVFHQNKWDIAVKKVIEPLNHFMPERFETEDDYHNAVLLRHFLSNLSLAVETKSSIVTFFPLPDLNKLERIFSLDILIPIKNLIASITSENTNLPITKDMFSEIQFQRFQEIICSDLFRQYSSGHQALEDGRFPKEDALAGIESSGKKLLRSNKNALKLKRLGISIIPISTKVIDTIFGKLPGSMADFFGQKLAAWLKDDRRIVAYRFDPIMNELLSRSGITNIRYTAPRM